MMQESNLKSAFYPLWITYAVVPLAAGADKFFNLLVDWDKYIAPAASDLLPVSGSTFMMVVGVVEIAVGVLALTPLRRLAAYIASAWLTLIALNLLLGGWFDIAVRDLAMGVGAFALGQIAGVLGDAVFPGRSAEGALASQRVRIAS
jgi:hypothetical protein